MKLWSAANTKLGKERTKGFEYVTNSSQQIFTENLFCFSLGKQDWCVFKGKIA